MKKILAMLFVALLPLAVLTSCGDDNKGKGDVSLAQSIVGIYPINVTTSIDEPSAVPVATDIIVSKVGDNKVDISLKGFKFATLTLDVNLDGATLSGKVGDVVVAFNGPITTSIPLGELSGTIVGTIKGKVLDFTIVVNGVPVLNTITVTAKSR